MDLIIEIEKPEVAVKSGTSARTGKPYSIREQKGYVQIPGQKYPQPIRFALDDDAQPYQAGRYNIDPSSFYVGRFEDLNLRLRLCPVVASAQPAQRQA